MSSLNNTAENPVEPKPTKPLHRYSIFYRTAAAACGVILNNFMGLSECGQEASLVVVGGKHEYGVMYMCACCILVCVIYVCTHVFLNNHLVTRDLHHGYNQTR